MEITPYFERTLFYDHSPAANEYYEIRADQVFETNPSKTRIAVCVQSCENAIPTQSLKIEKFPDLHDHKNSNRPESHEKTFLNDLFEDVELDPHVRRLVSKNKRFPRTSCQEIPVSQCGDRTSDRDDDNCSVSSEASSTALPIAMDQGQAESGPPLYPGPPRLMYGDLEPSEILSFTRRTKHDFRVFYLRQKHSFSRLQITKANFETLVRSCHVFPRFNEYVIGFGRKSSESEVGPPPLKFRPLYGDIYRGFECAYVLRYVENTNRTGRKKPWSLRQFGVYHRFKKERNRCSTWILVGASQRTEGRLDRYTRSVDNLVVANPFELHVIFLDTVITSWRPYLVYITLLVSGLSNKATGVCIRTEGDNGSFVSITVEDHQQLKEIEDDVADVILCLDSTSDTLTTFEETYGQFCQSQNPSRSSHTLDAVAIALREKTKEILYTRRKAEALLLKIQNTRTLISSLLERQSGHNINHQIGALREGNSIMQHIAEKNMEDSSSMRVLTIITMIYLPCTIVSNFYSTQFVSQAELDGGSKRLSYAQNAWVFFAISVPLTIFTFSLWYAWTHIEYLRSLFASQLSVKKKAELPL